MSSAPGTAEKHFRFLVGEAHAEDEGYAVCPTEAAWGKRSLKSSTLTTGVLLTVSDTDKRTELVQQDDEGYEGQEHIFCDALESRRERWD